MFSEYSKSKTISELFNLFSLIVHEESYLEDQKSIVAENNSFYPETCFTYLKNFKTFINHTVSRLSDNHQAVNIFDPNFLAVAPIEISEKRDISFENLLALCKFNDCCDINLADLESFKSFYFPSSDKGIDYKSFLDLFLPYSNKNAKKNCLKRKILYEVTNLESMNLDLKLQSQLSQILEDEIQLFKRSEEIKIKLINELRWDPIEAFNNLDNTSLSYLDFASLEIFFQNFGEKFSTKDFEALLKRINKNSNSEFIYLEDFKRLTLPFKTYFTLPEKIQNTSQSFARSQVIMERVDHAVNEDKYLILKSTYNNANVSQLSDINGPSKIRQAVFADNIEDLNKSQMNFSMNNSRFLTKSRANLTVSNPLTTSHKPLEDPQAHQSLYISKNDGVGKNVIYSRCPANKIIQDLYGEHKFTNLNNPSHGPANEFPFPFEQKQQVGNSEIVVNPKTNFDNERLLKAASHEKKIYTPLRQNPQLMLSLNNEFAVRNENLTSPFFLSKINKPLFYSNTKEMKNVNQSTILPQSQIKQSFNGSVQQWASPAKRKIFDGKEMHHSRILNSSIDGRNGMKNAQRMNEPEMARRQLIENNQNQNISKPTPPLII